MVEVKENVMGFLKESLNRNNSQIKKDRAEIIEEDLEMEFNNGVQKAAKELKRTKRELRNMYDFSPTTSQSLVLANDLDAELINRKDTELTLKIRELQIVYEARQERYKELFGKEVEVNL
jgi:hypothetical protein